MKNKKIWMGILLLVIFFEMISFSYALWSTTLEQLGESKIQSTCFSLSLTNEKNEIRLQNSYPILDSEGKSMTPYSFTITNTCDLFASFEVKLEMLEESKMPIQYVAVMMNNESIETLNQKESRTPTLNDAKDSRVLATGSLGSGDSEDYTLRLWIDEDVTLDNQDSMNTFFKSKIVVTAIPSTYNPIENGIAKLSDVILANEYQTTPEIAKEKIHHKQVVDFSKTAPLIDWRENHESTLFQIVTQMPHPEKLGEYAGFTNVEQSYVKLGKSYTFHKDTGYYDLEDIILVDPTTISDYTSNNYYYCESGTNISLDDKINSYSNHQNCNGITKVSTVTKENKIQVGPSGKEFQMIQYHIEGYHYTQIEFESDQSDKGLYETEDDLGTSYYYRGSVKNNHVKFGDAYYQIIRVNGDGSVRLLYNGITPNASGEEQRVGVSDFRIEANRPGYGGYMYGNVDGSTIEEVYANAHDSRMKTYLDAWYKTNIVDKNLSSFIADSGFCNDRTLSTHEGNGDGIQITERNSHYGAYQRYFIQKSPSLRCPNQERDYFTTGSSNIGNKVLQYPIGLITVDELAYAGMSEGYINRMSYVYSNQKYWTMSPSMFSTSTGTSMLFSNDGSGLLNMWAFATFVHGVRPVINLSKEVEITGGIGTSSDPFVVKIN